MDLIDKIAHLGVGGLALIFLIANRVDPSGFIGQQAGMHRGSTSGSSVNDNEIEYALRSYGGLKALLKLVVSKIRNNKGWDQHEVIRQVGRLSLERKYKANLVELIKSL